MVNRGYQTDDAPIIDYKLWALDGLQLRGPSPDWERPYFAAVGAAQVFGRFAGTPFPELLARALRLQAFNVGMSGAGPSFFLRRPRLLALINRAQFAIVHIMSGRSVSNRMLSLGINQGVLFRRDKEKPSPQFAEVAYRELLNELPIDQLVALRSENRDIYVREMQDLLTSIAVPKLLLYWSDRAVDYRESVSSIGGYWGGFPHFVNREMVDLLRPFSDRYIEVEGRRGLPQHLINKSTGVPVVMWPEDKFPDVKLREHNHYYPSPEMHEDAFQAVQPACKDLLGHRQAGDAQHSRAWRDVLIPKLKEAPLRRKLLIHLNLLGNDGSAIDGSLEKSFGQRWRSIYSKEPKAHYGLEELLPDLEPNGSVVALSCHRVRFPSRPIPGFDLTYIVMLRHPVMRARYIYECEGMEGRGGASDSNHTKLANRLSFSDWVDSYLSGGDYASPIANYQTRVCSFTKSESNIEDSSCPMKLHNYQEAAENLRLCLVGTVERFSESIAAIERRARVTFPELILSPYLEDGTARQQIVAPRAIEEIRLELGDALFGKLCDENRYDLLLHNAFA